MNIKCVENGFLAIFMKPKRKRRKTVAWHILFGDCLRADAQIFDID